MTISTLLNRWAYTGNGAVTDFTYTNIIFATSDLEVYADNVLQTSGFTVSGVGAKMGGTVSFTVAPGSGVEVVLLRNVPATQETDYTENDDFPEAAHELALDKLTVLVQQTLDKVNRAILLADGDETAMLDRLPLSPARNDGFIGFNSSGQLVVVTSVAPATATVTAFSETVLDDPSASDWLTTLGFSTYFKTLIDDADAAAARATLGIAEAAPPELPIINGEFDIWQRGLSFAAIASGACAADRWSWLSSGSGVITALRTTGVPANDLNYSLQSDVTTADASLAATDIYAWVTKIEGYDALILQLGTPSATQMTLRFWVNSPKAGAHSVAFRNGGTRSYVAEYTVAVAGAWEQKTITLTGDLTGTWGKVNDEGLSISFVLAAGTNFHAVSNGVWEAANKLASVNQVNCLDNVANNFFLAHVELFVGATAGTRIRRNFAEELARCQRYYWKTFDLDVAPVQNGGLVGALGYTIIINGVDEHAFPVRYPQRMRSSPSLTFYNPAAANGLWRNTTDAGDSAAPGTRNAGNGGVVVTNPQVGSDTNGDIVAVQMTADAEL